jgi:hypothetical protein
MRRVTLNFSEDDYRLFHHYCSNYCRLYDETRKNSIKIFLELYKHQVIQIQDHNLNTVFAFFFQKKQEFEIESQTKTDAKGWMRLRITTDILTFLEDLENIYLLLKKKGAEANYFLIVGVFSTIIDEENRSQREEIIESSSAEIDAIVSRLATALEKKLGEDIDIQTLLFELVRFARTFNRLSKDVTFNDEIIDLIAPSFVRKFINEENDEKIRLLLLSNRKQFEIAELESVLDGGRHAQDEWDFEFSWQDLLEPLRTLNKITAQNQGSMRLSLDVLSALEAPVRMPPAWADPSQLTIYQRPSAMLKKQIDENQFLVNIEKRQHSEVQIAAAQDYFPLEYPSDHTYKQYFSVVSGVSILFLILLISVFLSLNSVSVPLVGNSTGNLSVMNTTIIPVSGQDQKPAAVMITPIPPLPTPTPTPTPVPTPQYVTIEPLIPEPDTGLKSNRELYDTLGQYSDELYNPKDYLTIFRNNLSHNLLNAYKISFDLKNPPMVIRYTVIPHNITDIKWFEPRDPAKLIDTATVNRPDEFSYFEIKIYQNNELYDQQGWGRQYGIPLTQQEIVIRNPGLYRIEFSGDGVTVDTEMLVKKEGNINV